MQNGRINVADLAALIAILESAYDNPNRVADAENKLNNLQQGTRDFASYMLSFNGTQRRWIGMRQLGYRPFEEGLHID